MMGMTKSHRICKVFATHVEMDMNICIKFNCNSSNVVKTFHSKTQMAVPWSSKLLGFNLECTMNVHTKLQGNPIVDISVWAEVVAQSTENKRTVEPAFPLRESYYKFAEQYFNLRISTPTTRCNTALQVNRKMCILAKCR